MNNAATDSSAASGTASDVAIGTPAAPAFVPRRGLFIGLLILFVIWIGILIAMSIQLHRSA